MYCYRLLFVVLFMTGIDVIAAIAAPLVIPNTYDANQILEAASLNANFDATKDAVNDNDQRITNLNVGSSEFSAKSVYAKDWLSVGAEDNSASLLVYQYKAICR